MGRSTMKYMTFLIALMLVVTVGGVFAVWQYAEEPVKSVRDNAGITITDENFVWRPEEILPDDKPGEDYLALLYSILENTKIGLNSNKGRAFEDAVEKYKIVHWGQNIQGGNLKHLEDLIPRESQDLDFVMQYVSDTEFHLYIIAVNDVEAGLVNVTKINAFKTVLKKGSDGEWVAEESQQGYATLRYLPSNNHIAILPDEWVRGNLPA